LVSSVILKFNGLNYSASNVSSEYSVTIGNLSGWDYDYTWYAYDGAGNENVSSGNYVRKQGGWNSSIYYNSSLVDFNLSFSIADSMFSSDSYNCSSDSVSCSAGVNQNNSNLVSYWALDGDYLDSKGSNDGTPTGTNNATGISSGAMRFDGVDDYINLDAHSSDFSSLSKGTISSWVKYEDTNSNSVIFGVSNDGESSNDGNLNTHAGGIRYLLRSSGSNILGFDSDEDYNDNQWHHVVLVVGDSGNVLYVDGENVSVTYFEGSSSSTDFLDSVVGADSVRIGNNEDSGGNERFFNGSIDEVLI
jgi:hypothetical protein